MDRQYLKIAKAYDIKEKNDRTLYRFFEAFPGILTWGTLIGIVAFSFFAPLATAVFIIIFDVYYLIKTLYLTLHLRVAFKKTRTNMGINWRAKLDIFKSWQEIYHLVILPTFNEPLDVLRDALRALEKSNYPKDKIIVVIGQEERAGHSHNKIILNALQNEYNNIFYKLIIIEHPSSLPGERPGKGSNASWAAQYALEHVIDRKKIPHENVLVSNFDIDTVVFPEYFGRLTYAFLTAEDRLHTSYQPVPFYTNNIWEAPSFARIVAFSSTFWQTIQQERLEHLITFSSHSMPLSALIDVGFWQPNVVSEDSRIFWQCFLRYDGNYRVTPLFYPVAMDANVASKFWQTMINIYRQHRRWGYGAENIAYALFGFSKNRIIPPSKKLGYAFRIIEGFWSWATNTPIIFLLGWLPILVGGVAFQETVVAFNMPLLTRGVMFFAMIGMATTAILSLLILPPRPPHFGRFKYLWMVLQWALLPLTLNVFGALPGIDAQTRLMFGKYMGFWITPKARRGLDTPPAIDNSGMGKLLPRKGAT